MEQELQQALDILQTEACTCVLCGDGRVYRSNLRGVRPLLQWLDDGVDLMGFSAADKVVGRGAAFLYRLLGVRRVHGCVMSVAAVKVLRAGGIEVTWDALVEGIRNRAGDGPCTMEAATEGITDPEMALEAIRQKLRSLQ